MHPQTYLVTLALLAIGANAAPLNINLGAYSPALVVGDGALTFEGGEAAAAGAVEARDIKSDTEYVKKRDLSGFDRALTFAENALTKGPKVQLGTGEGGAGVGIIVDNNPVAAARPGKGEAEAGAGEGAGAGAEAGAGAGAEGVVVVPGSEVNVPGQRVQE
jgi:hypothetical protein